MNKIKLFEEFDSTEPKKKATSGELESYEPPKYLVQPAENDKGFFMFRKAFDKMKKRFAVGYFSSN